MKSISKIKTFLVLILALFGFSCLTACGPETVPVGNVGIKVYKYGANKGIDQDLLSVGWYWIGINEDLYLFPMTAQHYVFAQSKDEGKEKDESISFQTAEGTIVSCDVGISYSVDPSKVTVLFQKYRMDLNDITTTWIRLAIRNQLNSIGSKDSINTMIGGGKEALFKAVQDSVSKQFAAVGLRDFQVYLVGTFRLPQNIENSINNKIQATQDLMTAKTQADKKIAEAMGEAKSNEIKRTSVTPELLQFEQLSVQREAIHKWDGKLPQYSAGQLPFINVVK